MVVDFGASINCMAYCQGVSVLSMFMYTPYHFPKRDQGGRSVVHDSAPAQGHLPVDPVGRMLQDLCFVYAL